MEGQYLFTVVDEFITYLHNVRNYSVRTLPMYRSNLSMFFSSQGITQLMEITPVKAEAYLSFRKSSGISQNTNATFMNALRAFVRFCNKRNYMKIPMEDFEQPKRERTPIEFLTGEEVNRMVGVTRRKRDQLIMLALYTSGARVSEIVQLAIETFQGDKFTVIAKGNKPHVYYMDAGVAAQIRMYCEFEGITSGPIFTSTTGKPIEAPAVTHIVRKAAKLANISHNVHPHMFRHGFATAMLENGADIRTVAATLGHEQIQTTMRYMHVTDLRKQESHQQFAPKLLTSPDAYATIEASKLFRQQ